MLKEILQAKLQRATRIGSNSSTISPDAIQRPSMTEIDIGWDIFYKIILCARANSRSMKQELAPESKRAEPKA
jgi:hypothetical protein